jgi:hypothetical protein
MLTKRMRPIIMWDLKTSPITFDIVTFLAWRIATCRQRAGRISRSDKELWICCEDKGALPQKNAHIAYENQVRDRINTILLPSASLFPEIVSVNVLGRNLAKDIIRNTAEVEFVGASRKVGEVWPARDYSHRALVADAREYDLRIIENDPYWLKVAEEACQKLGQGKKVVAIPLRANDQSKDDSRDSDIDRIVAICRGLEGQGLQPVVLPDQNQQGLDHLDSCIKIYEAPAFSLQLRSCFYEKADVVYTTNMGHAVLAQLNRNCHYLLDGFAASRYFDENWLIRNGYVKDKNPFAEVAHQVVEWKLLGIDRAVRKLAQLANIN